MRFTHVEDKPFSLTRPPTKKGAFRISPGRIERHTVENLGDAPSDFLRVELKQAPLHSFKDGARVDAPALPLETRSTVEFANPAVTVRRVICTGPQPCPIEAAACGAVIVALSPVNLTAQLTEDAVQWISPGQSLTLAPSTSPPAHILEVVPYCA